MSVRRAPLPVSAPKSEAALIYAALWAEIRERMHEMPHATSVRHTAEEAARHALL